MRHKKIFVIATVLLSLHIALNPVANASASLASEAETANRYGNLAIDNMWLQAADKCLNDAFGEDPDLLDTITNPFNINSGYMIANLSNSDGKTPVYKYLNLKFPYKKKNTTVPVLLYSSYLEMARGDAGNLITKTFGDNTDSKMYCAELAYNEKIDGHVYNDLLPELLLEIFNEYNAYQAERIACDSSLFQIYVGYGKDGIISNWAPGSALKHGGEYSFPGEWVEPPNEGSSLLDGETCHKNFDLIKEYLASEKEIDPKNGNDFLLAIKVNNKNFKISEWLKNEVGDIDSISDKVLYGTQLVTLNGTATKKVCPAKSMTKEEYTIEKERGTGYIYEIFNDGKIEYIRLSSDTAEKKIYASGDVTKNTTTTCDDLAKALSPDSAVVKKMFATEKIQEVIDCAQSAWENTQTFKEILKTLEKIQEYARDLSVQSRNNILGSSYVPILDGDHYYGFIEMYADKLSESMDGGTATAVNDYVEQIYNFKEVVNSYIGKIENSEVTEQDNIAFEEAINDFDGNYNTFQSNVVDEVKALVNEIPDDIDAKASAIREKAGQGEIENEVEGFYVFDDGGNFTCTITSTILSDTRDKINSIIGGTILFKDYKPRDRDEPNAPQPDNDTDTEKVCKDGSGFIGWLVCPLIKAISGIGNSMWTSIEKTFMIIPVEIFDSDKGVQSAWSTLRDIGNVVFIILFLVVIFSQLTGVGIDNYGIKKILPRLIMVAILANLSWIICELVADVSNIVGSGISDMLTSFAGGIAGPEEMPTYKMVVGGVGDFALAGGAAALFVLANGWNLAAVAALGLAVLGIVMVLVAGIITMYLILIIREAGIILAIVLAPVAIVCYALPNTEKLAKKWLDLFKALLVVYPLCGAAIGAGKLASAVLASVAGGDATLVQAVMAAINGGNLVELTNSVFAAASGGQTGLMLAAMIVQVLPFFFIPTLLRNSLSLMGNIGARISQAGRNLGRRASTGLQRGVQNSERFKDFQKFQQSQTAERRAQRVHNRLNGRTNLTRRQQDRLRKADDTLLAQRKLDRENQVRTSGNYFEAMQNKQDLEFEAEAEATGRYTDATFLKARSEGIKEKAREGRVADYEALLGSGTVRTSSGAIVNTNDARSVGAYHAEALARYKTASSDAERDEIMAQIKAAQNVLSKTDKGRAQVYQNFENSARSGDVGALSGAAAHIMNNYGDKYKSVNRGAHALTMDLATSNLADSTTLAGIQAKLDALDGDGNVIASGAYSMSGVDKYTPETLANADDEAIGRMITAMNNGSLSGDALETVQSTAYTALQESRNGNLQVKPEIAAQFEKLIAGYTPKPVDSSRARVLSHGAYEDSAGNVLHLREMDNGKFLDDSGVEVDITHFKRR